MTGLYKNISALQNEKSLTFLYRAPKVHLGPLNIGTISEDYQSVLGLDDEKGLALAKLTKGYSFAFQVLGYFTWEHPDDPQESNDSPGSISMTTPMKKSGPSFRARIGKFSTAFPR